MLLVETNETIIVEFTYAWLKHMKQLSLNLHMRVNFLWDFVGRT